MFNKLINSFQVHKSRNAFYIEEKYYTYEQFYKLVFQICHLIKTNKINDEKLIGIIIQNDIETYASIVAVWFSGCGFIPLNPSNPVERNVLIFNQSKIKSILSSQKNEEIDIFLNKISTQFFLTTSETLNEFEIFTPTFNENKISYLFYTSGSTGIPKGVPISFKNLKSFVDSFFNLKMTINENDRFLQMFDLTFDLSVFSYLIPLCSGACVFTVSSSAIKYMAIYQLLDKHKITVALMVPSILSFLRSYFQDIKLPALRYCLFCGEALQKDIVIEWKNCIPNSKIFNVYGPTENTIFCTSYKLENNNIKSYNGIVSIGKPMKHVITTIIDENKNILSDNEKGELCLAGELLTSAYYKDEQLNKKSFFIKNNIQHYRTGDIAFTDDDGDLMFCGRADQQVKIHGFRVELNEIEHLILEHFTDIENVAAIPFQNSLGNTLIWMFIQNYKDDTLKLFDYLKTKLPDYMIPTGVTVIKTFPLNVNGKVDRKALRNMLNEQK